MTSSPSSRAATSRSGLLIHVPRNVVLERPDRRALERRRGRPRPRLAHPRQPRRERPGADARGAGRRREAHAAADEQAEPVVGHQRGAARRAARTSSFAGAAGLRRRTRSRSSTATRRSARTRSCAGHWPASARSCTRAGSTTASSAVASACSQVEIGFGGGKQLFDLTSYTRHIGAGHDRRPAQQGRLPGPRARLLQGHRSTSSTPPTARTASSASSRCCSPSRRAA